MINKLTIKNFRNHKYFEVDMLENYVYITGSNGSGKTSILESIYLVSNTKSHRTNNDRELIKEKEQFAHIILDTDNHKYEVILSSAGKVVKVDNKEIQKLSDFIGRFKVVMFSPEDIDLIKGSPGNRRNFLNIELMKLDKSYLNNLSNYRKVLKQRNSLLKQLKINEDLFFLDKLSEQLYSLGLKITNKRLSFIKSLNKELELIYATFSKHEIKLAYNPNSDDKQFKNHLFKNQKQDILYETTTAGPHRDDFTVSFNGHDAKSYASQGQIKLIAITMKLALLKIIRKSTKDEVVLLLDDVLSELDEQVQNTFLNNLPRDIQIIMNSVIRTENKDMQIIELKESRIWKIITFMTHQTFKY